MSQKLNFNQMATQIIENLGGKDNLSNVNHCATRLRVVVNDSSLVKEGALKKINGVLGVEFRDEQVQVIVGAIIEDLFLAVEKQVGTTSQSGETKKDKNIVSIFANFLQLMAGIMSPVIPALIAAGFLTCLLLVLNLCGLPTDNSTYVILNNLAQTVFYFLPVFVAYTSAKKFDTEPVLAMVLACWLLYPDWVTMASAGGWTSYFGIPTLLTTYNGAVLQIILSVWIMSLIDKQLKKYIPISARHFLKPFLLILFTSVITLTVTGPLGGLFTNYIAAFIEWVRTYASWAAVAIIIIFASTIGVLCPGFHLALIPIATASLATVGYDDLINIWFYCCTITPGFIALAVALKTKRNNLRQIAYPAALSALFGGISEPTTYGISYKMPIIYACSTATSIITSIYAGIVHLKCYGFGGYSLTNILLYLGPDNDTSNFIKALIGVGIMFICSFVFVFLAKWDDSVYDDEDDEEEFKIGPKVTICPPAKGEYVPMNEIKDPVFAKGTLGQCFAVEASEENIIAPISGVINSVAPIKHAITIKGDSGAEVMVHIGIESTRIEEGDISVFVKVGDKVKAGDKLAKLNMDAFTNKNMDKTIIAILLNSSAYNRFENDSQNARLIAEV